MLATARSSRSGLLGSPGTPCGPWKKTMRRAVAARIPGFVSGKLARHFFEFGGVRRRRPRFTFVVSVWLLDSVFLAG